MTMLYFASSYGLPKRMFSLKVAFYSQAVCGTYATDPLSFTVPDSLIISPRSAYSKLDLPAATCPTMATISPGFTEKLMFLRIVRFFRDYSSRGVSLFRSSLSNLTSGCVARVFDDEGG